MNRWDEIVAREDVAEQGVLAADFVVGQVVGFVSAVGPSGSKDGAAGDPAAAAITRPFRFLPPG